jgi:hypothetical protein
VPPPEAPVSVLPQFGSFDIFASLLIPQMT